MAGFITANSIFVPVAGRQIRAVVDRTPLTQVVTQVTPCPYCGERFGCDCLDWLEWMLLAEPTPQECIGDAA